MKRIVFLSLLLVLVFSSSALAASRVALVVGNGAYQNAPLRNPVNDATDMAASLKRLGFEVTLLTDASKRQMKTAMGEFSHKLPTAEIRFFYFAGHGMQVAGENYLIPVKAEIAAESDVEFESVNAGRILGAMRDAGPGVNIVVLDACRNNPFARSHRSGSRGLARMDAPTGSLVAYATAPGSVAADGHGRNGLFTEYLLKNIERKGIALDDILRDVRGGVVRDSDGQQVPWASESLLKAVYLNGEQRYMVADGTPTPPASADGLASILVESEPSGATLFVNGTERGRTPVSLTNVKPGNIDLRLEKTGFATFKKTVSLTAGQRLHLPLVMGKENEEGELVVQTKPSGAHFRIVGVHYQGHNSKLAPGSYQLEVSEPGYWLHQQSVEIAPGQEVVLPISLKSLKEHPAPEPVPGKPWTEPSTGMEFVWVPGGCFQMGSNDGRSNEKPIHEVCVDGFWMGKYEVTQAQWSRFGLGTGFLSEKYKGRRKPVSGILLKKIDTFLGRLREGGGEYRLPTEAEWEYAARSGGKEEQFPGGGEPEDVAWFKYNSDNLLHDVGGKSPNGVGLFDMAGNVWEYCVDLFAEGAYRESTGKNEPYAKGGIAHVARGGSYQNEAERLRTTHRANVNPMARFSQVGFRVVKVK